MLQSCFVILLCLYIICIEDIKVMRVIKMLTYKIFTP